MAVENYNGHASTTGVKKWSATSRLFHWGSVILLIVTWAMITLNNNSDSNVDYMMLHKSFGASLLFWMIARFINRIFTKAPPPVTNNEPLWQTAIAHLTHWALYALLFAMPIAGILMSVYGGRPVSVFGLFEIPVFVEINRSSARFYNDLHTGVIWPLILLFTAMHIGAALFHQFIKKDNLLARMR